ncbi:hypothetical protein [Emticicia sp. W12TSBA100-4]|uniref:hypothetical protein n=1 Tax=Emticicia sp. W12TSBA100-4 TaxID=3160965 RepID=UPI00330611DA
MKPLNFCLSIVLLLLCNIFIAKAQDATVGASFAQGSITVGGTTNLNIKTGNASGNGSFAPGDIVLQICVPTQFYTFASTTVPPAGTDGGSYNWTYANGCWQGTNNTTINPLQIQNITVPVIGVAITTAGAQTTQLNVLPQGATDEITSNNSAAPSLQVTAAIPTMSCNTNTLSPNTYTINGSSQTGTYKVGVANLVGGANYSFEISGSNFSGKLPSYVATGSENTVDVPVTYNGGGAVGSQQVTVTGTIVSSGSPLGTPNTCNLNATLTAPVITCNAGSVAPTVR